MLPTQMQAITRSIFTDNASVEAMFGDITAGLNALGIFTRMFTHEPNHSNSGLLEALLIRMLKEHMPFFMVGMNAKDNIIVGEKDGKPLTVHDSWAFPLVTLMVDHPAYHLQNFKNAPENCIVAVIDEGHLKFLHDADLSPRTHVFCPHGGPEAIPDPLSARERTIDVLFCGNVNDPGPVDLWLDQQSNRDPIRRAVLKEAFEAVYEGGVEGYQALTDAFSRHGQKKSPHALAPFIAALDAYVTQLRRVEVLEAIKTYRITILGDVSPDAARRLSHHDLRGVTTFVKILSLMAESKLVLNSRRTFARGAHERIFYALSRGAVAVTDPSTFLAEDLNRGLGMVRQPEELKDLDSFVSDLVTSPDRIDTLRAQGLETYSDRHTWRERMGRILPAVMMHLEKKEG